MKILWVSVGLFITNLLSLASLAESRALIPAAGMDAPELAARGTFSVGVKIIELVNPKQIDVVKSLSQGGQVSFADRKLALQVWYPAAKTSEQQEFAQYPATFSPSIAQDDEKVLEYRIPGFAVANATPESDKSFPLVVLSHGFNGDFSMMSYLGENLASKGYVVAAIDHYDFDTKLNLPQPLWFASALMNRAKDQAFVIDQLPLWLKENSPKLDEITDSGSVALVGYSMGGFGMMSLLGAGLDKNSRTYQMIPNDMLAFLLDEEKKVNSLNRDAVKVAVALAPWGAQAPFRSWSPQSLEKITKPVLFVAGDRDDISQYNDGVKWLYETMTSSSRYLLVYQNARHNIGGNPAPKEAQDNYRLMEFFNEPVWRKERIVDINKHFISAFLDWHLKDDVAKKAYFDVEHPLADEGTWPVAFPEKQARFSGGRADTSNTYWKGFKRRTALGLELHYREAKTAASSSANKEQVLR